MPFAVHIGPTVLLPLWAVGGFVLGGLALLLALWRVSDRDIPRIGVLTATFSSPRRSISRSDRRQSTYC
jgi:hypothetical protein